MLSRATLLTTLSLLAVSLWAIPGHACQYPECHATGAVQKPGAFDIVLPFSAGESVQVLSGYGPSAGSSLHCRAQDASCANDYYALDLVLPDKPNHGLGEPVKAIASGTVVSAGWGSSGWAPYGRRVYVEHDFDDGHRYISMYAHLDSVAVSAGQAVAQGAVLGTLGASCNSADSCANFSTPHLHFAIHRDSNIGGSGSGGSYGGRAVIPEPFDGYSNLHQGQLLTASGGGGNPPPPPPPTCGLQIADESVIEEDGPCASLSGGALDASAGHGGHSYHTAQDNPSPDYAQGVVWLLPFAAAGDYEVWAYIPDSIVGLTPLATYKLTHAGGSQHLQLDQAAAVGSWALLGTFAFAAELEGQWLRLGDNHDDPTTAGKQIAFDAIRVVPSAGCACHEAGSQQEQTCTYGGVQGRTCDGCHWSAWSACQESSGSGGSSALPPGTAGSDAGDGAALPNEASAGGVQGAVCSLGNGSLGGGSDSSWLLWVTAIAALGCRRRGRSTADSRS